MSSATADDAPSLCRGHSVVTLLAVVPSPATSDDFDVFAPDSSKRFLLAVDQGLWRGDVQPTTIAARSPCSPW